jgi:AraC-like DNA-binding protein
MKLQFSEIGGIFSNGGDNTQKPEPHGLTTEQSTHIQQTLDEYILRERPFLRRRYSLRELSEETGIAMHQVSAFLNKEKGVNFNDFINRYRIDFCLQFLENSAIKKVNLIELGAMCGFNNRSSFATAFKRITGDAPSAYIRKIDATGPSYH